MEIKKEKWKTLKDIGTFDGHWGSVSTNKLKQEAIKHIKRLRNTGMHKQQISHGFNPVIDWIMYYFNIEESDLK